MEKTIKKIFIFITFFVVFLNATPLSYSIHEDVASLRYANKSRIVKIYHDLENIYIQSIIDDNKKAQIDSINGLIECSKILKINYRHYQKELSLLLKYDNKQSKIKEIKKEKDRHEEILNLISAKIYHDKIILLFNHDIKKNDVCFFVLKNEHKYRDVFDIKGILRFKIRDRDDIKIAQYNKKIIRVVLSSVYPINSTFSIEKQKIIIKFYDKHTKIYQTKNYTNQYFSKKINFSKKIVVIDPGHGGKDTGAIGYKGLREKNAVLKIAKKVGKYLRLYGYKVYFTRDSDVFISLRDRTHFANLKKADIFISIHANAAPIKSQFLSTHGVATYYLSPASSARAKRVAALENSVAVNHMGYYSKQVFLNFLNSEKIIASNKLAIDVQRGILKSVRKRYNITDRGVRKAPFWVLVGAQMPAILIETGFITNPTEAMRLFNPYYEDLLAQGIANGVVSYFEKNR